MSRTSLRLRAAAGVVLCGLVANCDKPDTKNPVAPSAPVALGIEISGPDTVIPGQSVQYTAQMRLSDGTRKPVTAQSGARWRSSGSLLSVNFSSGAATAASAHGEVVLTVEVNARRATKEVVIIPEGTYRLVGRVWDEEFPTTPVVGAKVAVSSGNLSTHTDRSGAYRLYGVPPTADIQISAAGYVPTTLPVQLARHTTQEFRLTSSSPRLTLAGPYTLALDVTGSCGGLTSDQQHRTYDAAIVQNGLDLDVRLTEPRFRIDFSGAGNRFSGRSGASGATFELAELYFYYYYYLTYPGIVERLTDGSFLAVSGQVETTGSPEEFSGMMTSGSGLVRYTSSFPLSVRPSGSCGPGVGIRFTFTRR